METGKIGETFQSEGVHMKIQGVVSFLPCCLKIGSHHEQHSDYLDQEVHDQQTTSVETNGL